MLINEKPDILVIGAGIMGVSSAFFLAHRGYKVMVIDRGFISNESSGVNPGSISLQNKPYPLIPICKKSIEVWESLGDTLEKIEYRRTGGIRIAEDEEGWERLKIEKEAQKEWGLKVETLDRKELESIAPYFSSDVLAANYCHLDGYANARLAVREIGRLAREKGVSFMEGTNVESIVARSNDVELNMGDKRIQAERVLLTTGAWLKELCQKMGLSIPFRIRNNQVMVTSSCSHFIQHMLTHINGELTIKQLHHGNILIGGGLPGKGDFKENKKLVSLKSAAINAEMSCRLIPKIRDQLILRIWSGFDGRAHDQLPIFDRLPHFDSIYVLSSCFGGFTMGPYLGQLMAQYIDEGKTSIPMDSFSFSRFNLQV